MVLKFDLKENNLLLFSLYEKTTNWYELKRTHVVRVLTNSNSVSVRIRVIRVICVLFVFILLFANFKEFHAKLNQYLSND